jgi:hypothetical protein
LSEAQTFTMSSYHFSELVRVFHCFRYKPTLIKRYASKSLANRICSNRDCLLTFRYSTLS